MEEAMPNINTYSPDGRERLIVQYDREGGQVMLGLERTEEVPLLQDGKPVVIDGEPVVNHEFPPLGGSWMPVDRTAVNHLIRSLREARDKAFGKDE